MEIFWNSGKIVKISEKIMRNKFPKIFPKKCGKMWNIFEKKQWNKW